MNSLMQLAKDNNIFLIEDAAHAFGSCYEGKRIGSLGHLTCFSFDPIKNITCGEGGAITTNESSFVEKIFAKRILGIEKDTYSRSSEEQGWFYQVKEKGFRYHLSNINAAIGLVQLNKFEEFDRRKKEIVKRYDSALSSLPYVTLLKRDYHNTAFFNYVIKVSSNRDQLISFLFKNGIDSGVHYIPNHLQPVFKSFITSLPKTERVWKQLITLPLYFELEDSQIDFIVEKIREFSINHKMN
jgi:perosamine synthetase